MRSVSLRARLVAAALLVQLTVLLAVMAAVFLDARAGNEEIRRGRALEERLLVEWASRVDADALEAFCRGEEFVEETAILDPGTGLLRIGKASRERTPAEAEIGRASCRERV